MPALQAPTSVTEKLATIVAEAGGIAPTIDLLANLEARAANGNGAEYRT
jgi:hypothetical protein